MSRNYNGDINGCLGPASADVADRFGFEGQRPNYLEYFFDKDNFDINELRDLIKELNEGCRYISSFFREDNYTVVNYHMGEYTKEKHSKIALLYGVRLGDDDNLFYDCDEDELVNDIRSIFDIFYCFEDNDKRDYQDSNYGMKVEELSNEDTDKILQYFKHKNYIEKLETVILGVKIYNQIQKNGECNFSVYY